MAQTYTAPTSASPVFCRTTLNYLSTVEGKDASVDVDVLDGRRSDLPGWRACGFELVHHPSSVTDWNDDDELARVHYPEIEALAKRLVGCDHALVSSHLRRSPEAAARHFQLSPISFVHSDFAGGHAELIRRSYRDVSGNGKAALARNGASPSAVDDATRIVILQFWRNIGPPKMDYPVAFCDARSVSCGEARAFAVDNYADTGYSFEALGIVAPKDPSAHRWYTFPELTADETIAFRTYDTDLVRDGGVFFTPHSAFPDPDVPVGKPARSSIELRCHCLFTDRIASPPASRRREPHPPAIDRT